MKAKAVEDRASKQRFWKRHLESWRLSDLSQAQYCRLHGLNPQSFSYWKNRTRASLPQFDGLVEVPLYPFSEKTSRESSCGITIRVGEHYRVEVSEAFDAGVLERVLWVVGAL